MNVVPESRINLIWFDYNQVNGLATTQEHDIIMHRVNDTFILRYTLFDCFLSTYSIWMNCRFIVEFRQLVPVFNFHWISYEICAVFPYLLKIMVIVFFCSKQLFFRSDVGQLENVRVVKNICSRGKFWIWYWKFLSKPQSEDGWGEGYEMTLCYEIGFWESILSSSKIKEQILFKKPLDKIVCNVCKHSRGKVWSSFTAAHTCAHKYQI